jgi:hypothetical protein
MSVKQLIMRCPAGVQLPVTAANSLFTARTSDMGQAKPHIMKSLAEGKVGHRMNLGQKPNSLST